jgi:hypothetical protein
MAPSFKHARKAITDGKLIGAGSYRKVYGTDHGKWVYKVNTQTGYMGSNASEYDTYLRRKESEMPDGVKLPEMHLLEGNILAAERIKGVHPKNWCELGYHPDGTDDYSAPCPGLDKCWAERTKHLGFRDLHPFNVIETPKGDVYIIDLGHG